MDEIYQAHTVFCPEIWQLYRLYGSFVTAAKAQTVLQPMCTGMPVNRPEEQASTHYFVFIQIKLLLKFIAKKYMFLCVCGKTLFLHAQFLLLRMTYKLKCFINFIVQMAIARTLIHTMSIQYTMVSWCFSTLVFIVSVLTEDSMQLIFCHKN